MKASILVVDDEKTFRVVAEEALDAEGYQVTTAASGETALRAWDGSSYDVVILDRRLPDVDGLEVLQRMLRDCRERGLDTVVIMATAYADIQEAVTALKAGAYDYLAKPVQLPDLVVTVRKAVETLRLRAQVRQLSGGADADEDPLGISPAMKHLLQMVGKVAQAPHTTVLIQGESGTGKELIAHMIHRRTPGRREQPLVEINCASLPENLLESELFGHEKGAFTDAKAQKRGLFEMADGGTLFLDEIGEMPLGTQAKLLRVLETMSFRRLGGTRDLQVNLRIIAATNRDLPADVRRGAFRLDLFHRLDVFHLEVPPLRQRPEDIVPLARRFLERFSARVGKRIRLPSDIERLLSAYTYPGNVRELRNITERAVILSGGEEIRREHIVISGSGTAPELPPFFAVQVRPGDQPPTLEELERGYIGRLLELTHGNRTQAARLLGVSYPTIAKKITDYGLTPSFKVDDDS
jgi:DNA-binding NtrC family response regulator